MKIAIVNSPFSSHIGRMEYVFQTLKHDGHELEIWGSGATRRIAERNEIRFREVPLQTDYLEVMQRKLKPHDFYNEMFFPMAAEQLPTVLKYCEEFAPDVLEVNTRVFSGTIASMITGVPLITHACNGSCVNHIPEDLYGFCVKGDESPRQQDIMRKLSMDFFRRTDGWFNENIAKPYDLGSVENAVGLCSPEFAAIQTIRELSKTRIADLPNIHLTGAIMSEAPSDIDFTALQPYCYVSLGTCPWARAEILERYKLLIQTIPADYRIVIGLGQTLDEPLQADPARVTIYEQAPQIEAIRHAEFVVCHGGSQTVHEALHFGKPLIGIPHYTELSEMVNSAELNGAAVRIAPSQLSARSIEEAVRRVTSADMRSGAERLSALLRQTDGHANTVKLFEAVRQKIAA